MPQLIALGLIGGVLWVGYRAFKREMARVNSEVREAEKQREEKTVLEQDEDGVYRPVDRD